MAPSSFRMLVVCALALSIGRPAASQGRPRADAAAQGVVEAGQWQPFGFVPVDQAGGGRRGYVLPGEGAEVTAPEASRWSMHAVAANNFYREQAEHFLITERAETHTIALGYRRGLTFRRFPRVEIGGQIQLHESDSGVLNGFIAGVENGFASLTGHRSARSRERADAASLPSGTVVMRDGQTLFVRSGRESGVGDVYLVAKAGLLDGAAGRARVAARVALNLAGASSFTAGNFMGIGLSADRTIGGRLAVFGDLRVAVLFDRYSPWGPPLRRASAGYSIGPELRLTQKTSLALQIDGNTTPYREAGALAFDEAYGDATLGLSHRFAVGGRRLAAQLYARENMNLPLSVRWNTDPDLAIGLKLTLH